MLGNRRDASEDNHVHNEGHVLYVDQIAIRALLFIIPRSRLKLCESLEWCPELKVKSVLSKFPIKMRRITIHVFTFSRKFWLFDMRRQVYRLQFLFRRGKP